MRVEELLENTEGNQFRLISLLRKYGGEMETNELLEEISLSKVTLNKYITEINFLAKEKQVHIELLTGNDTVSVIMGDETTWQEVIYMFINQSVKYPLLIHLFNNREATIKDLSDTLMVSEATVNRQISSLNKLLKEFSLMIRNGKITGPEHLIKYFYYRLFLEVLPGGNLTKLIHDKNIFHQVSQMENILGINFSVLQKYKISLWLLIILKRTKTKKRDYSEIKEMMEPYQAGIFYRRVYSQAKEFFNYYKIIFEEGEVMCLFAFFISMEILPSPVMEKFLGFGGPIMEATRFGIKMMKNVAPNESNINEDGMYELSQIFSTIYFFKGDIITNYLVNEPEYSPLSDFLSLEVQDEAAELYEINMDQVFLNKSGTLGDLRKTSKDKLFYVLSFMKEEENKAMKVGVDVPKNEIYTRPLMYALKYHFQQEYMVTIDWYDTNEEYDLVISGHFYRPYINKSVYYLKGSLSFYDLKQITERINEFF